MNNDLFYSKTPSVTVLDNRGLAVRNIAYHRHPDTPETTNELITYHKYDDRGFLIQSADPRMHNIGRVNFTYLTDFLGTVIRTKSIDAGISIVLNDIAGRPFMAQTGTGVDEHGVEDRTRTVIRTWHYENNSMPGRLLSVVEQMTGEQSGRVTERFIWAGGSQKEQANNLAGQCVSHYDQAGLVRMDSVALCGVPLSVTRQLLKDTTDDTDWTGENSAAWNTMLSGEENTTLTAVDSGGSVVSIIDATGNQQRVAYDVAGLLKSSWLTIKNNKEQIVVKNLIYSAAGQKLQEEHGNGVLSTYSYEKETQRLTGIKTERPAGHSIGAKVLQDLRYEYDPVGNILSSRDEAGETYFWKNQKVAPESAYVYDSLYQLVRSSGREMANISQESSNMPSGIPPLQADNSVFANYTRNYKYDAAGNLMQIRHNSPATNNTYTTNITISNRSNRAVLATLTQEPEEVDNFFTADGFQKTLMPGQSLLWSPRGELVQVTPVSRDEAVDDFERYLNDSSSQRVLKTTSTKKQNSTELQRVEYLPHVELRTTTNGNTVKERLSVLTVGEAGRAQVRVLHWETGIPDGIGNNQFRYSYDSLTGNSNLEMDGDGNVISAEEYYPFGGTAILVSRSQVEVSYKTIRYSGKERDVSGLYYYGYRYYQPWVGRWLSADPSGEQAGLNLYCFVNNNPVSYSDEEGLQPWPVSEQLRNLISKRRGRSYNLRSSTHPVYQTALRKRHLWSNNPGSLSNHILNDKDVNPFADSVTMQAQPEHDQLLAQSRASNALSRLTEPERNIINLYSQESLPFHTITLGMRELNAQEIAQGYHMGQGIELINALSRLPEYPGTTYRGAFIEKGFTYDAPGVHVTRSMTSMTAGSGDRRAWGTGDYVTTKTFFSTSAARGVAAEFIMRQRFSADFYTDTAILSISGHSGRNITELTHIEQAEVLYPAYSVFRVEGVRKGEFGLEIDLHEVNESIWNEPDIVIRDYRYGNVVKQRPSHMILH